jgi:hypothetical protein
MIKEAIKRKQNGAFFTPASVAGTLVQWVVKSKHDLLLDPSCGDGQFLLHHRNSVGVEFDAVAAAAACRNAYPRTVCVEDFFTWAEQTRQRFDCVAGNPPFIRYQRFTGAMRLRALALCRSAGLSISQLTSSWTPFIVASTRLLKPGARMAFVVPAEIGHASYAKNLLGMLARRFGRLGLIAIRERVFPELSQDVWILYGDGFGGATDSLEFVVWDSFHECPVFPEGEHLKFSELMLWRNRLRPFLLSADQRRLYRALCSRAGSTLGELARIGIGYVTGANDFFHLRPSQLERLKIPRELVIPSVRNARLLDGRPITRETVNEWIANDQPCLLLALDRLDLEHPSVRDYLESPSGRKAKQAYKCRSRDPWYRVPDVVIPDAFLSYMSGEAPCLVRNDAGCTCPNSLLAVTFHRRTVTPEVIDAWQNPLTELSCELEGHPLGGGMLKLEPREAGRVCVPTSHFKLSRRDRQEIQNAVLTLRSWRHYG